MTATKDLPILEFADRAGWEQWLEDNHQTSPGAWLKIAKNGAKQRTPTYAEALEAAICVGWIDGQKGRFDESFWLQRFTPRGPRSRWSQVNREKAERLIADKRMRPAGLTEVELAQRDGRWEAAYPAQSAATVPEDFQRALDAEPDAKAFFQTLTGAQRYSFLYRLHNVKRPQTREQRIANYMELLRERRTLR